MKEYNTPASSSPLRPSGHLRWALGARVSDLRLSPFKSLICGEHLRKILAFTYRYPIPAHRSQEGPLRPIPFPWSNPQAHLPTAPYSHINPAPVVRPRNPLHQQDLQTGVSCQNHKNITGIAFNTERRKQDKREGRGTARSNSGAPTRTGPIAISPCRVVVGGVVVESSSRRVFRRQYQEGYGWEAAALCDSSQLIGRVLVPGFP